MLLYCFFFCTFLLATTSSNVGVQQRFEDYANVPDWESVFEEEFEQIQQRVHKATTPRSFTNHQQIANTRFNSPPEKLIHQQQQAGIVQTSSQPLRESSQFSSQQQTIVRQSQQQLSSQQQQQQQQAISRQSQQQQSDKLVSHQQQQKPAVNLSSQQQLDKLVNYEQQQGSYAGQSQQQQLDKLVDQQRRQQQQGSLIQQTSRQQQQEPKTQNIVQDSVLVTINQLKEQFAAWQAETRTANQNLTNTISSLNREVDHCVNELLEEKDKVKQLSKLLAALEKQVKKLEEKITEDTCPSCVDGLQLQLTSLSDSYKATVPQLSLDVSVVKQQMVSQSENLEQFKKQSLGGFSNHAEIVQLLKQTSTSLASTAGSFNATAQIILTAQKSQETLIEVGRSSCATAKSSEPLVKSDAADFYLQLKNETERTINRLARIVASKDALKISSGFCPKQLGFNSKAPCKPMLNSCYCVVTSHLANWFDADRYCRWYGMSLVSLETPEENDVVYRLASSYGDDSYWLGGTDRTHKGTWMWTFNETLIATYTNWASSQSTNVKNSDFKSEDCLEFGRELRSRWGSNVCTAPKNFICEAHMPGFTPPSFPAFSGAIKAIKSLG